MVVKSKYVVGVGNQVHELRTAKKARLRIRKVESLLNAALGTQAR